MGAKQSLPFASLVLVAFVSAAWSTGCGSSSEDDGANAVRPDNTGVPPTVSRDAIVFDAAASKDVRVEEGALEIPLAGHEALLARIDRGSVLVGQPAPEPVKSNPRGFLRRVITLAKKTDPAGQAYVRVETSAASLRDVFTKGRLAVKLGDKGSLKTAALAPIVTPIAPKDRTTPIGTFGGPISASIEVPLDLAGASNVEGSASVDLEGSYALTPELWANATYANDAANTATDLQNCFQPRPACAQAGQVSPIAECQDKPLGMWCAATASQRVFCDGQGNGCVETCSDRYGAGSVCDAMPSGTDDQCREMPGASTPRVCLDRGELTHLELGAAIDLTVDVTWTATVQASVNGERAVDQITPNARQRREIGVPIATNVIIPGAVPIPVELRGTVYATCEVAAFGQLSASGTTHIHVNPGFGVAYDNGSFSPLPFAEPTVETQVLEVGGAAGVSVKCSPFKPRLSMLLFDGDVVGIGPYVEAGYYRSISAQLQTDASCPILVEQKHGIEATVGGEMRIFGVEVTPDFIKEGLTVGTNWPALESHCLAGQ